MIMLMMTLMILIVKEEERLAEKRTPLPKPPPIKTDGEKEALRNKMKEKVTYYSVFIYNFKIGV